MLEKSKIKQILLDKSLGQILKVDRPIESIQQDKDITPLKSFSQHFHTTAGREFVSIPCLKSRIDQNSDQNWKFIRPRTPSISFNCKPRVTIFDEKRDVSQQQGLNVSLSWEPIQKPIPLNKQTKRKPWFTLQVLHDCVADHQKPKPICFVNYTKATHNKERPRYDHQIDDSKVAQTYLKLKYYKKYLINLFFQGSLIEIIFQHHLTKTIFSIMFNLFIKLIQLYFVLQIKIYILNRNKK